MAPSNPIQIPKATSDVLESVGRKLRIRYSCNLVGTNNSKTSYFSRPGSRLLNGGGVEGSRCQLQRDQLSISFLSKP